MRVPPGGGFQRGAGGFSGGSMRIGPGVPLTPVIKQLLIINIALFAVAVIPGLGGDRLGDFFALIPADVFSKGRVWQLVTYMFLHGGFIHLLFNMLMLWMFGTAVEARWGSRDFVTYYFVCGVGGALLSWAFGPSSTSHIIGASGAVLGVILAYTMMYPDRQVLIWFLFPVKMKILLWVLVGIDLLGVVTGSQGNTAHFAHLGGMAAGFLYLKQDWRLGAVGRKLRGARARRKMQQQTKAHEKARGIAKDHQGEIDRILEKISNEGMDSLTEQELKLLRDASGR